MNKIKMQNKELFKELTKDLTLSDIKELIKFSYQDYFAEIETKVSGFEIEKINFDMYMEKDYAITFDTNVTNITSLVINEINSNNVYEDSIEKELLNKVMFVFCLINKLDLLRNISLTEVNYYLKELYNIDFIDKDLHNSYNYELNIYCEFKFTIFKFSYNNVIYSIGLDGFDYDNCYFMNEMNFFIGDYYDFMDSLHNLNESGFNLLDSSGNIDTLFNYYYNDYELLNIDVCNIDILYNNEFIEIKASELLFLDTKQKMILSEIATFQEEIHSTKTINYLIDKYEVDFYYLQDLFNELNLDITSLYNYFNINQMQLEYN